MTWFPLFIDSQQQHCLVVGGGKIALHKLRVLLHGAFVIRVVAPEILPEIQCLPVECCLRESAAEDLEWAQLVVDATGKPEVGQRLHTLCVRRGVPLNVVDCPQLCTFIFPAMLHRGKLTAAISSGGASPIAAAWVRDALEELLPDFLEALLEQLEQLRPLARERIPTQELRAKFLKSCFTTAMKKGSVLSQEELDILWKEAL